MITVGEKMWEVGQILEIKDKGCVAINVGRYLEMLAGGLTPAGSSAAHSHLLTLPRWQWGKNWKSESVRTPVLR